MTLTGTSDAPLLPPGSRLDGTPYRILRLIGSGGMGEVYEAEHEELGVRRALKVLTVTRGSATEAVARLRAEARALARLRHPNIVEALDLGTSSRGHTYFAMELLAGLPLRSLMGAALPPRLALHVAVELLEGLEAAHRADLVHRDVKPENVFVCTDGRVRILDFGVAKWLADDLSLTQSGVVLGTPRYMAPEQLQGEPVDGRADVYAVGVLLHELLTGGPPFADDRVIALAYAHVSRPPPPLVSPFGVLPKALQRLAARALAKQASERPASAAEFAAELRGCDRALGRKADEGRELAARLVSERLRGAPPPAAPAGRKLPARPDGRGVAEAALLGSSESFVNVASVAQPAAAGRRGLSVGTLLARGLALSLLTAAAVLAATPEGRSAVTALSRTGVANGNEGAAVGAEVAGVAPAGAAAESEAAPAAPPEPATAVPTVAVEALPLAAAEEDAGVERPRRARPRKTAAARAEGEGDVAAPAAEPGDTLVPAARAPAAVSEPGEREEASSPASP